jgi:uroporphyrinogen decarboxylase
MIDSLTSWRNTIDRKPGCRIPRYANFTPDLLGRLKEQFGADLAGHFGMDSVAGVALAPPAGYERPDFSRYYEGRDVPADMTLNEDGVGKTAAGFYHFFGFIHPLVGAETVADIEAYPLRDYVGWSDEGMAERVANLHRAGRFVAGSVGHTYETSWQIRGYEEFLTDLMLRPAMAEALLDRIANRNCLTATATGRAGVDYLRLGDDVASQRSLMFPPELWRRIFKPRLARIIEAGRKEKPELDVWYHSDGNIWEIIPDLIEVGVTILNPIQPECMDPVKLQREYGRHLVLDGTIGTQSVMPFGTPDDVTETVRRNIGQLGQAGGLILSPTHVLEPEVPIANIEAFFTACDTYGNG